MPGRRSIGSLARFVLGPRIFHIAGRFYSRAFGNYRVISRVISGALPPEAHVLDVGGGDGAPLNFILPARPDIKVTMIDIASTIGGAIEPRLSSRVEILPETTLRDFSEQRPDVSVTVLILDVMHHVVPSQRASLLRDLHAVLGREPHMLAIIKDIEPDGSLSARLNYLADRYISNDRNTSPVRRDELVALLHHEFGESVTIRETELYSLQPPHYALVVAFKGDAASTL